MTAVSTPAARDEILASVGLTAQQIARDVVSQVLGSKIPVARPLPDEEADRLDSTGPIRQERP